MPYNGFDRVAKFLPRVLLAEKKLDALAFDFEVNNLGDSEVEADPTSPAVRKCQLEVVVVGSGGDEEEVDPDRHLLLLLVLYAYVQKLLP